MLSSGMVSGSAGELLLKAQSGAGLQAEETAFLLSRESELNWDEVFAAAADLTEKKFHKSVCFFAPLYFSSFCVNECVYCGFRRNNKTLSRKTLTTDELIHEARYLWEEGHRTLILIAGEHPLHSGAEQIARYMEALKRSGMDFFTILESGPLTLDEYRMLKDLGLNQCLLFQETYNRDTYSRLHEGPKKDFDWRVEAMGRAAEAGIDRVGFGILLGIHDHREDLISLIRHAWQHREKFGRFPSTVSLPRLRSASGVSREALRHEVSDEDFRKLIALIRLSLPETGLIMTTRESAAFRDQLMNEGIGITHVSAGCSTVPGGYTQNPEDTTEGQFDLQDHRPLGDVVALIRQMGYHAFFSPSEYGK